MYRRRSSEEHVAQTVLSSRRRGRRLQQTRQSRQRSCDSDVLGLTELLVSGARAILEREGRQYVGLENVRKRIEGVFGRKVDDLGLDRIENTFSGENILKIEASIGDIVFSYFRTRPLCTLKSLNEHVCRNFQVESFDSLRLGPLSDHPVVRKILNGENFRDKRGVASKRERAARTHFTRTALIRIGNGGSRFVTANTWLIGLRTLARSIFRIFELRAYRKMGAAFRRISYVSHIASKRRRSFGNSGGMRGSDDDGGGGGGGDRRRTDARDDIVDRRWTSHRRQFLSLPAFARVDSTRVMRCVVIRWCNRMLANALRKWYISAVGARTEQMSNDIRDLRDARERLENDIATAKAARMIVDEEARISKAQSRIVAQKSAVRFGAQLLAHALKRQIHVRKSAAYRKWYGVACVARHEEEIRHIRVLEYRRLLKSRRMSTTYAAKLFRSTFQRMTHVRLSVAFRTWASFSERLRYEDELSNVTECSTHAMNGNTPPVGLAAHYRAESVSLKRECASLRRQVGALRLHFLLAECERRQVAARFRKLWRSTFRKRHVHIVHHSKDEVSRIEAILRERRRKASEDVDDDRLNHHHHHHHHRHRRRGRHPSPTPPQRKQGTTSAFDVVISRSRVMSDIPMGESETVTAKGFVHDRAVITDRSIFLPVNADDPTKEVDIRRASPRSLQSPEHAEEADNLKGVEGAHVIHFPATPTTSAHRDGSPTDMGSCVTKPNDEDGVKTIPHTLSLGTNSDASPHLEEPRKKKSTRKVTAILEDEAFGERARNVAHTAPYESAAAGKIGMPRLRPSKVRVKKSPKFKRKLRALEAAWERDSGGL